MAAHGVFARPTNPAQRFCALTEIATIVYIGDQVADARAASENGVHFVGLAHHPARLRRLREIGVEPIYQDYTDLDAFLQHLRQLWEH